ncbi:unnamed protein product [Paramecium sonneborni]|uniref:Transmembrane protein n=1 Tax=Paramecium sonneborni TaxID=65129 RepID=A0A8S1P0I8_9CILI|nr:unnamed protein product [Paramecium sonneborni]
MIIQLLFFMTHANLIQQSYSIQNQDQAVIHLSFIKQFTTNYQFGDLNFNLSIQANHQYTLLYIPDSSSNEYYCVVLLKSNYQDCFKQIIFIQDDEQSCQQNVTTNLQYYIDGNQSYLSNLICNRFQNLTISNFHYKVKISESQTLITPALIILNRFVTSKEGLQINFQMNFQVLQLEL